MFLAFQSCLASSFLCHTPGAQRGKHTIRVFSTNYFLHAHQTLLPCILLLASSKQLSLDLHTSLQSSLSTHFFSPCVPPNTLHKVLSNHGFLSDVYLRPYENTCSFSQTLEPKDFGFPHRPWEV